MCYTKVNSSSQQPAETTKAEAAQSLLKSRGKPSPQALTISTASCGEGGGLCSALHWWEGRDPSLVLLTPCSPPSPLAAASWNQEGRSSTLSHGTSKYHLDTTVTLIAALFSLKNVNLHRIINLSRKEVSEMLLSTIFQGPLHKFLCSELEMNWERTLQKCWSLQRVCLAQRDQQQRWGAVTQAQPQGMQRVQDDNCVCSMSSWYKGKPLQVWLTLVHVETCQQLLLLPRVCSLSHFGLCVGNSLSDPTHRANSTGTWPFAPVQWLWFVGLKCSWGQWGKLVPGPWTPHVWKSFPCEGSFPSRVKSRILTCSSQATVRKDTHTHFIYICIHTSIIYVFCAARKAWNTSFPLPGLFFTNLGLSGFSFLLWLEGFSYFW